jgi:hypothetical protein
MSLEDTERVKVKGKNKAEREDEGFIIMNCSHSFSNSGLATTQVKTRNQ